LVSEISSELKRIPLANQRRINAILKRFEPLRQNLVLFQNENSRNGKGSAIGLEMAQERDETTINEEESSSSERRKGIEFDQRETNAAFRGVVGRNLSACDRYMRCHHQMVIGLDRCGVLSNLNSTSLSTESLLEVEDNECLSKRHDEAYNHLYELVMKRNKKLRQCLGDEQNWECLRRESIQKIVVDEIKFDGIKSIRECYSNVNVLQCREQTADAEVESQIISLTAALSAEKYRCVLKKKGRI
uniref:HDAC_interact domain-containing protein n=1 Tax=Anisakis simplex TaxID=6269 RepID=A0A0M3KCJ9_ANISI